MVLQGAELDNELENIKHLIPNAPGEVNAFEPVWNPYFPSRYIGEGEIRE
ncbi:uncharacterized protein FOMMEDRAFT_150796 [Fomitiporia mediterranea MF3/22]|nr:uncharacterized protein FOMMEDRAFT_150796 [Fomitiporia mediterranea MF3/22]EJD08112.1 hypothetical protein FOMMEDRAFT_150796 [Fomitiporia mediterranea MF3/22]